jgi:hypothetical protein
MSSFFFFLVDVVDGAAAVLRRDWKFIVTCDFVLRFGKLKVAEE